MQKREGFTIIELIVVIAIIAVLAAIVLVNVTQYINKSKDAAIKGNLRTIQAGAVIYYSAHDSYIGLDEDTNYISAYNQIDEKNGNTSGVYAALGTYHSDEYCVSSSLNIADPGDEYGTDWCVDSTGYSGNGTCCEGLRDYCTTPSGVCG